MKSDIRLFSYLKAGISDLTAWDSNLESKEKYFIPKEIPLFLNQVCAHSQPKAGCADMGTKIVLQKVYVLAVGCWHTTKSLKVFTAWLLWYKSYFLVVRVQVGSENTCFKVPNAINLAILCNDEIRAFFISDFMNLCNQLAIHFSGSTLAKKTKSVNLVYC